ncbi:hypothetical protein VCR4J5_1660023 [Vibrio crassostreae]|uniref:Uncharacterized protein n=3 Tax=Vibrio TaxID=662 RepID=A0A822MQJ2_9VIBR|nr:hypothetical protein VCRA2113O416_250036 [Vibrio crassostreae]CAV20300.1 hypothetical protein VS_3022 [Vibrio atlanticus]CDT46233.1 hypothetical protein VCR6J2_460036 [Vibrio coralliirubri]CAK1947639.1 hypothetical protein VCRA2113O326_210041 [Vibrio crassostreae]CAK1950003.1 hypothetical protein VCRA2113O199_250045 [Vibrio crassostreae]
MYQAKSKLITALSFFFTIRLYKLVLYNNSKESTCIKSIQLISRSRKLL